MTSNINGNYTGLNNMVRHNDLNSNIHPACSSESAQVKKEDCTDKSESVCNKLTEQVQHTKQPRNEEKTLPKNTSVVNGSPQQDDVASIISIIETSHRISEGQLIIMNTDSVNAKTADQILNNLDINKANIISVDEATTLINRS